MQSKISTSSDLSTIFSKKKKPINKNKPELMSIIVDDNWITQSSEISKRKKKNKIPSKQNHKKCKT